MVMVLVYMMVPTSLQLDIRRWRLHLLLSFELVSRNDLPRQDGVADRAIFLNIILADFR